MINRNHAIVNQSAISNQQSAILIVLASGMPTAFTRDDVARIAALADLELDADEIEVFARQLADILAYADQVQQIDTTGVPPTASVVMRHSADRPDETRPCLDREAALANAPDAAPDAGLFKVPRVL
jgi:aspartyl-tRNA(Asn)/glutamyl-tRNA(Gln) amidotransferase subunit C